MQLVKDKQVKAIIQEDIIFPTSYNAVLERVYSIDPVQYGRTRNFVDGAVTYVSPYISRGVISVKQVMDIVLQKGYKPYQVEKFLQELAWREYFQCVWQHVGDGIWNDMKQPQPEVLHKQMIAAIEAANTGIAAIDEHIKKLYETGYMHNHVRMYTASLACNIGKAHWLQPSKWMYYHLLDGDIASNNCSWQWVAAAFASKKYYCNQENINKYTHSAQRNSFLDAGYETIANMPVPEKLRETTSLQLHTTLPQTALPVIDTNLPTLIYNSYNLDPLWHKDDEVNRILLLEPTHFEKYPFSKKVIDFIIQLAQNIENIQVYSGSIDDITSLYASKEQAQQMIISKEHPAFTYYPGIKESRDWMFPQVTGYHASFFAFWKKAERFLK